MYIAVHRFFLFKFSEVFKYASVRGCKYGFIIWETASTSEQDKRPPMLMIRCCLLSSTDWRRYCHDQGKDLNNTTLVLA